MVKFKVGDKVRVIDASCSSHKNGDIGVITVVSGIFYKVDVNGDNQGHYAEQIELVDVTPTKKQRISTLEQQVSELQAEVAALKDASKPTVNFGKGSLTVSKETDVAEIARKLAKVLEGEKRTLTPNEQRKAIIAEAKAFVAELTTYINPENGGYEQEHPKYGKIKCEVFLRIAKAYFVVKAESREVTCVIKPKNFDNALSKAIAKCAPDDVFNVDIGKAIALGRALGLDVKRFEQAVKPTEFAVGQTFEYDSRLSDVRTEKIVEIKGDKVIVSSGGFFWTYRVNQPDYQIIDDTDAKY